MEKTRTTNRMEDFRTDLYRGMNMQLFAEGAGDGGAEGGETGKGGEGQAAGGKQEKLLTQAEVDALIEKRLARAQRHAMWQRIMDPPARTDTFPQSK